MPLPHPEARNEQRWHEAVLKYVAVRFGLCGRSVDQADQRQAEEDVNPTKYRAFNAWVHDVQCSEVVRGFLFTSTSTNCFSILAQPCSAPLNA
jgi:hypothetical protein